MIMKSEIRCPKDTNRVKVDNKVYKVKNGDSMENSLKELFDELSE